MQTISVFTAEREAGLEEKIKNENSIAYVTPVSTIREYTDRFADLSKANELQFLRDQIDHFVSQASEKDEDLFPVLSVLVSTNWNKNDDIFDREEVWQARHTPSHKQTNLEHDDDKIVGHIVGNWAVDSDFALIQDDITVDKLPDVFHLITSSVIYRQRQNPETRAEVEKLIAEIEAGKKFVSMECIFHGFDYGVIGPEGQQYVIKRTVDSAFLTSHLRCYGGTGVYDNFRIGRVLRKITFSGKGFVDKPANPNSIIIHDNKFQDFSHACNFNPFSRDGVYILAQTLENTKEKKESISMADDSKILEDQINELKASLKELQQENVSLKTELSQANVKDLNTQIETLASEKTTLETDLASVNEELEKVKSELTKSNEMLTEATNKNKELEESCASMKQEMVSASRVSTLVDGGFDKETAVKKVEIYASLSDEQFTDLANELIAAKCGNDKKKKKEEMMDETEAEEETEAEAEADEHLEDAEVISTAETDNDADLSVASDNGVDESVQTTRANLIEWVTTNVLKRELEESK